MYCRYLAYQARCLNKGTNWEQEKLGSSFGVPGSLKKHGYFWEPSSVECHFNPFFSLTPLLSNLLCYSALPSLLPFSFHPLPSLYYHPLFSSTIFSSPQLSSPFNLSTGHLSRKTAVIEFPSSCFISSPDAPRVKKNSTSPLLMPRG